MLDVCKLVFFCSVVAMIEGRSGTTTEMEHNRDE
jgi:hypothetical protein